MRATDQLLARIGGEIEDRQTFIDGLVEDAEKAGRDLNTQEMELIERARKRVEELDNQIAPLNDARRISSDSAKRLAEIAKFTQSQEGQKPKEVEYRTAGEYAMDRWQAGLGYEDAVNRLSMYHRAAAHQTTSDAPGLLPEPIVTPVVNFIDAARPLISALGPRQLPAGVFHRPKVTQHTAVTNQSAEKAELTSQEMTIAALDVTAVTYGGYVNVSRQLIDWATGASVLDMVIQDLAAQYAIKTEDVTVDALLAGATAASTNLATGTNTADQIAGAFWGAAGQVYAGVSGAGRMISVTSPQMLGLLGPVFAPINPQDAQSQGFYAGNFGSGAAGAIGGIPVYVTPGLASNKILVMSTAAAEVYEDRIGALQVVEPSVLGVQVAYAGYFAPLIVQATGIIAITKTP